MARTIPKTIEGRLSFFTSHFDRWDQDPEAIGLSTDDLQTLKALLEEAKARKLAADVAHNAARAATGDQNIALAALAELGATLIAKIRVKAVEVAAESGASDGERVYTQAELPLPTGPATSSIPPAKPAFYTLTPRSDGAVVLSWATDAPRVDFYEIERRVALPGQDPALVPPELLSAARDGTYVDLRLPIGFAHVQYIITPIRDRRGRRISGSAVRLSYVPGRIEPRLAAAGVSAVQRAAMAA